MSTIKHTIEMMLERYSWRQQLTGLLVMWVIGQCLLITLVWRPVYQQFRAEQQHLRSVQQQWHQRNQDIAQWRQAHTHALIMQQQLDRVKRARQMDDAVAWFTEQAQALGLVVEQVMWTNVRQDSNGAELRFRVLGQYAQIGQLLNVLSQYLHDIALLELEWQASAESEQMVRLSGRLHVLSRKEDGSYD
ncbi:MAG: hypothetical protein ACTMIA_01960 [Vibrio sp.]